MLATTYQLKKFTSSSKPFIPTFFSPVHSPQFPPEQTFLGLCCKPDFSDQTQEFQKTIPQIIACGQKQAGRDKNALIPF